MHSLNNTHFPTIYLSETHSTNSYLNSLCEQEQITELTTIVSGYQTAGRGQRGNTWESERDSNLLFSFVFYPSFVQPRQQFVISQIVALAIQTALSNYTDHIYIKWPNDIYYKNQKIAGILIENDLSGNTISRSIAGIGLNINQRSFTSDAPNPISLYQIIGKETERFKILNEIQQQVDVYYQLLKEGQANIIHQFYLNALYRRDGFHPYKDSNGIFRAQIVDIEGSGKLILKDEQGTHRGYFFKEVETLI